MKLRVFDGIIRLGVPQPTEWQRADRTHIVIFSAVPLLEIAGLFVRLDQFALTDLTHFRIFPGNLEPDFTHYLCEQKKENGNL